MSENCSRPMLFQSVEEFLKEGYALIPVSPQGKLPFSEALLETSDDASIGKYRAHPAASDEVGIWMANHFFGEGDPKSLNLAVLTGVNRLVVLDVDSEEIPKCLKDCQTAIVRTARGYHYYFSTKVHLQSEPNCTIDGVHCELRADGQYVVIPGSVHSTGCQYQFINPLSAIQPLPQAVVRQLSARNQAKCSGQQRGLLGGLDLPCVQALLTGPIEVGNRDKTLFLLFHLLMQNGIARPVAERMVKQRNSTLAEPFSEHELSRRILRCRNRQYHFSCSGVRLWAPGIKPQCSLCPTHVRYLREAAADMGLPRVRKLSPTATKVWVMVQHLRCTGKLGRMTKRDFAKYCLLSRTTLDSALRELQKAGFAVPAGVFKK